MVRQITPRTTSNSAAQIFISGTYQPYPSVWTRSYAYLNSSFKLLWLDVKVPHL